MSRGCAREENRKTLLKARAQLFAPFALFLPFFLPSSLTRRSRRSRCRKRLDRGMPSRFLSSNIAFPSLFHHSRVHVSLLKYCELRSKNPSKSRRNSLHALHISLSLSPSFREKDRHSSRSFLHD